MSLTEAMEDKPLSRFKFRIRTTFNGARSTQIPQFICPHLLKSNFPPSDDERDQILWAISNLEEIRVTLDRAPENDPGFLSTTNRSGSHRKIDEQIRHYRQILSPVRQLPTELLEKIFMERHPRLLSVTGGCWKDLPFVVSQVCQHWRRTAVSATSLWNQIPAIKTANRSGSELKRFDQFLQEILRRSQELPLEFCLDLDPDTTTVDRIAHTLVAQSHRWRSICITSSSAKLQGFHAIKGHIPLLENLSLDLPEFDGGDPRVTVDVFQTAPKLSTVGISRHPLGQVMLPWEQIHSLTEDSWCSNTIPFPPNTTPAFRELDLSTGQGDGSPLFSDVTQLPHLVKLSLYINGTSHDLQYLILPALESLVVTYHPDNVLPEIQALVGRTGPPCLLRVLGIRCQHIEEGELTALLKQTPHLIELDIIPPPLSDLQQLVVQDGVPPLVPRLRSLIIGGMVQRQWNDLKAIFPDIVRSRCEEGLDPTIEDSDLLRIYPIRLQVFRLKFVDGAGSIRAQSYLQGWDNDLFQEKYSSQLKDLVSSIHKELPTICPGIKVPFFKRKPTQLYPTPAQRLNRIMTEIEAFEVTDVRQLYAAALYYCLDLIAEHRSPSLIPGNSIFNIRSRASAVLVRWRSFLQEDVHNLRWVILRPPRNFILEYVAPEQPQPEAAHDVEEYCARKESNYVESLLDNSIRRVVPQTGLQDEYNHLAQLARSKAADSN